MLFSKGPLLHRFATALYRFVQCLTYEQIIFRKTKDKIPHQGIADFIIQLECYIPIFFTHILITQTLSPDERRLPFLNFNYII